MSFTKYFSLLRAGLLCTILLINFVNCQSSSSNNDSNNLLVALLASSQSTNCTKTSLTAISSTLVSNPSRTQYTVSGCSTDSLSSLNFTTDSTATLTEGTSSSSKIASTTDLMHSSGSTNIEVTFTLTSSDSYLDIYAYASGTGTDISGPAFRIVPTTVQYRNSSGTFANITANDVPTTATNTEVTYCLDFQSYSSDTKLMLNGWATSCSQVSDSQRNSMSSFPIMQMMNIPSKSGSLMGFVLSGVKIKSFTIGSIISQVSM
ncbi:MAG: hypothetical protein H7A23_17775 [Leptospiraceae bacterium]|nr:hypothetical protein [Leptospiraceae bacterium]MCP5496400.1 hypothetical protein [Leptospiraceae bacterium]